MFGFVGWFRLTWHCGSGVDPSVMVSVTDPGWVVTKVVSEHGFGVWASLGVHLLTFLV